MTDSRVVAGRFVIEREVGRGGIGIVYRAHDEVTNHPVALKVIALAGVDAGEEARFAREGRILAGLRHPNIVQVIAFGQVEDGLPYIAMEWLEGEDAAHRQRRAPLTVTEALEIGAQIADALDAAHTAGIVHRDVKPSNVFLVQGEDARLDVRLVDFGVASAEDVKLTRTGAILGTPAYMAPEQARGDGDVTPKADLYALGATLFELIAGRPPHVGPTPVAILARLVTTPAPRLSEVASEIDPELDDFLARLLATSPHDRPANAREVAVQLRALCKRVSPGRLSAARGSTPRLDGEGSVAATTSRNAGGSRLITSILATQVPKGPARTRLLSQLRARGADATELGGDAIVAHLGVKRAAGDEAARALSLGHRLAQARCAVGIATGRTRIDRTRPSGEVVDRAAALSRDARRGQVLADATTSELTRGHYEFQLRSDGAVIVGAAMSGPKDGVSGAPFVGRDAELAQITAAYERATDDRSPIVVTITGAPGLGKTRLRREALSLIGSHATAPRLAIARCESFGRGQAFGVVGDILRHLAHLSKSVGLDDALVATKSLAERARVSISAQSAMLIAGLMTNQLGEAAHPGGARDPLWMAATDIVLGLADGSPIVIALEDAQWADTESLAWLDHLLTRAVRRPVLTLATMRPTFWRDDASRFAGRDHVRIELRPLSRRALRSIARAMLGTRATASGDDVTESIAEQASGSPLFAEELARLAAQGKDAGNAATIEAAIQAHLDALDDSARDAASRFAVFGLVGWDVGLDVLGVTRAGEVLRQLATAEVLVEQASSRFRNAREWAFKHALTREVAYASLGEDTLKELHARAGHWLADVGEDDATVARHLELGGQSEAAALHFERAAIRALAANALQQSLAYADKALAFANDKPTQFARAQLLDEGYSRLDARAAERETALSAMAEATYDVPSEIRARGARLRYEDACGGTPETSAHLEDLRARAHEAGVIDEETRCAAALAARYAFAGELDRAEGAAHALLSISKERGLISAAVDGFQTLAVVHQARGSVAAALEARRSAAQAAAEAGLKTREATLTINVGFALTTLGAKEQARHAIDEGVTLARAVGSPGTLRHGQMNLLCFTSTFGSDEAADAELRDVRSMADAAASGGWVPHDRVTLGMLFYRGVELLQAGEAQVSTARGLLRTAAGAYRATKMLDVVPVALARWAEAERLAGDMARALELAQEAASLLHEGSPSLLNEAPVYLALHDASLAAGDTTAAKDAILRGIPKLVTRLESLVGTPYARTFLTKLPTNARLIALAREMGVLPDSVAHAL